MGKDKTVTSSIIAIVIILLIASLAIVAITSSHSSNSSATPANVTDLSNDVLAINPPGTNGQANLNQLQTYLKTGQLPPKTINEVAPYANLLYAQNSITTKSLTSYFFPETLGVAKNDIVKTVVPNPKVGVKIEWDKIGIPHIYGTTLANMAYGAGYAAATARLFAMDVMRHYGAGDLASFLGPSCGYEGMDKSALTDAAYDQTQMNQMKYSMEHDFGQFGKDAIAMDTSYVAGINKYIAQADSNPSMMPGIYVALGQKPQPWTIDDPLYIAALIGDTFGNGGGGSVSSENLLDALTSQFGSQANTIFTALKEQNDPAAPTTTNQPFPYMIPGKINNALTANLDNPSQPLKGQITGSVAGCGGGGSSGITLSNQNSGQNYLLPGANTSSKVNLVSDAINYEINQITASLKFPSTDSNALLVGSQYSKTGHPLAVFGPQVSYFEPEIFIQEDLHAPDYEAAGAGIIGISFVIEMGRGQHFAWSATSASADNIDVYVDLLCNPNKGPVAAESHYYMFNNKCIPMQHEVLSEYAKPTVAASGTPTEIVHNIYLTKQGIVQGFTTANNGEPVAVVHDRSTYMHDGDSVIGFLEIGTPSITYNAQTFEKSASNINFTFNWMYAGRNNIAFYESGLDPIRPSDVNPNLPIWGTSSKTMWTGFLGFSGHPHAIDPPSGELISWNNKPAPEFSANDSNVAYGPVYRSLMLQYALNDQLKLHHNKLSPADMVKAMESAATTDLDAVTILPYVLPLITPTDTTQSQMLTALQTWYNDGGHRIRINSSALQYENAPAIAIGDEFFNYLDYYLFNSLLGGQGVNYQDSTFPTGFTEYPQSFVDQPGSLGSAYDGGSEGLTQKLLMQYENKYVAQPYPTALLDHVCLNGGLSNCKNAVNDAFAATEKALIVANSNNNVPSWTADTASAASHQTIPVMDEISFESIGAIAAPKMDWQNRPTFQQVVSFT